MSKEAMKLALEALTATMTTHGFREHIEEVQNKAIKALEEALAKQEQCDCKDPSQCWEPCGQLGKSEEHAKVYEQEQSDPVGEVTDAIDGAFKCAFSKMLPIGAKLYTTPQPKQDQEPVAWGMEGKDGFIFDVICPAEHEREEGGYTTPLYTTPQPKQEHGEPVAKCCSAGIAHDCHAGDGCRIVERIKTAKTTPQQRKPLTDEQIFLCVPQDGDLRSFARAIEAAHGIKE